MDDKKRNVLSFDLKMVSLRSYDEGTERFGG